MNKRGNCYVAAEALYHALGGASAGWYPMIIPREIMADWGFARDTHWFLRHRSNGLIVDPSRKQFPARKRAHVPYVLGRGCGFLTSRPSKAARRLLAVLTWQETSNE